MRGRIEDKIIMEKKIRDKIKDMPDFLMSYYYYLNEKQTTTKYRYITQIIRFLNWFSDDIYNIEETDLCSINMETIQRYVDDIKYCDMKELSAEAKSQIYSSINSFMTFLVKREIIKNNPFDNKGIERPKVKDHEIVYLEPDEYLKIKQNIMNGCGSNIAKGKQKNWAYRDLLLFQLPIMTGVRVTALSEISLDDIDLEKRRISVVDKNRDKILYLDETTYGLILVWLELREKLMKGHADCPYLFISNQRKKLHTNSIREIIKKYTPDETTTKHITPHKLRSTCGTNMYRATKDIYMVAEVLGHTSAATTKKYTKVDDTSRRNASKSLEEFMKVQ